MSDYIKREDAINVACGDCPYNCSEVRKKKHPCMEYKELMAIPSADVAPVVRCKNCDYWNELEKGVGVCKRLVEAMWVDYTDFCSFAENKDDITYGERENDE